MKFYSKVEKLEKREKRTLTNDEYKRFARQLILPEVGKAGQELLINASVLGLAIFLVRVTEF